MNLNPFSWFKKEKKIDFPYHYAKIVFTEEAAAEGVFDVFQKEIQVIKNNKIINKISFTEADVYALKKVYAIPVKDLTKIAEEEYEFETVPAFGETTEVKKI